MKVLLIAGSPSQRSRSQALLNEVGRRLKSLGAQIEELIIRDLPSNALLQADFKNPAVLSFQSQIARAEVIVIATPVYKAAYSGLLKVFLDLLPEGALKGKTLFPIVTGGSAHHMLVLDYALRPVLQSIGAQHFLPGVYAIESQVTVGTDETLSLDEEISRRLNEAITILLEDRSRKIFSNEEAFASSHLAPVRCSA